MSNPITCPKCNQSEFVTPALRRDHHTHICSNHPQDLFFTYTTTAMSTTLPPPPPSSPAYNIFEDLLLRGVYDQHLALLELAIHRRRAMTTPALRVGDRIKLNDRVRPAYMIGAVGTIQKVNEVTVSCLFDETRGRFRGGKVKCPIEYVTKI